MFNESTFLKILNENTPILSSLDDRQTIKKPSPDKWSKKEILGHLIDSANNNLNRFQQALAQDHLVFDGYDQDDMVSRANYQEVNWQKLVDKWMDVNLKILKHLQTISNQKLKAETPDHNFHQICMRPLKKNERTNLLYLVEDYVFHLEHHLSQLIPEYQKIVA